MENCLHAFRGSLAEEAAIQKITNVQFATEFSRRLIAKNKDTRETRGALELKTVRIRIIVRNEREEVVANTAQLMGRG